MVQISMKHNVYSLSSPFSSPPFPLSSLLFSFPFLFLFFFPFFLFPFLFSFSLFLSSLSSFLFLSLFFLSFPPFSPSRFLVSGGQSAPPPAPHWLRPCLSYFLSIFICRFMDTSYYIICMPIRRRSYVIIGFVTPAIGPNKSKKLTRLISPTNNIRGKVWMKNNIHGFTDKCHEWHVAEKVNQSTMVEVIARRSLRINTLHTELRPSIESHHRPTVSVIAPWRTLLGGSLHNNSNFQGVYSNFAVCSVCRWCKPCEFLGFVWTGCYPIM